VIPYLKAGNLEPGMSIVLPYEGIFNVASVEYDPNLPLVRIGLTNGVILSYHPDKLLEVLGASQAIQT
jgi:hypothetical protein